MNKRVHPARRVAIPTIFLLALLVVLACSRERTNPLDPANPHSDAVLLAPPETVSLLAGFHDVSLSWARIEGAEKYGVYRDGGVVAVTPDTSFVDTGLSPGAEYIYQVSSIHGSGLEGARSDGFSVSTRNGAELRYRECTFYDGTSYGAEGNGDGLPNKGETVRLGLTLWNVGSESVEDVVATLSTDDVLVVLDNQYRTQSFFAIGAGDVKTLPATSWTYGFSISDQCPPGHVILFRLSIRDRYENTWADSFTVTVEPTGAFIRYDSQSLYDGSSYGADGNSDGTPNKGETVRLGLSLRNIGTSDALDVRATLNTDDVLVVLDNQYRTQSFFAIGAGDVKTLPATSWTYGFSISDQCPPGHVILFRLSIRDRYENTWADSFTVGVVDKGKYN